MKKVSFWMIALVTFAALSFSSCSDDDFTSTIFDTNDYPLDRSMYTFPLDTFVKKNFLEPYNVKFIYRMEDIGSDLQKNLTPAKYEKSVTLAVLSKYLWYDVYEQYGGDLFLKENSPRIIHVIGSKNRNPSQGTETLGVAEGGLKISLFNVNNLDVNNIDVMNEYFFKTMHHEFGHILDQTHLRPTEFNTISSSQYDAAGWGEMPDSVTAGRGFVSPYASSAAGEDWVEVLANYITRDSISWAQLLNSASYEWEQIDIDARSDYESRLKPGANRDTIGYLNDKAQNGDLKIYRRICKRNADDTVALDENGQVQWVHDSGVNGYDIIMRKLDMVRTWMRTYYNIEIDDLRKEVQKRQYVTDANGNFVKDNWGRLVNNLVYPVEGTGKTLIEILEDDVEKYKSLMTN